MRVLFALSVIVIASGCSKRPATTHASQTSAQTQPASAEKIPTASDPNAKHGTRKLMGLDVPVFVDGAQAGVLRHGDLPTLAEAKAWNGAPGFRLYDYLQGIGIAPEKIRSVHVHGNGDRIGSIEGSELRADKDRFVFSFTSGDTGAPIARWSPSGLKNSFVVHEIRRVTVYVAKASPAIDPARQCHLGKDGQCSEAIPYAQVEPAKGTRVYLDGKMVGFVKRRQLGDALVLEAGKDGETKFSLAKFMASVGVDASGVKAVELVAGDDVIARADASQWAGAQAGMYFTSPQHSHGKVKVHVPAAMQSKDEGEAKDRDALVTSVLVYKTTAPAARSLVAISEDTDLSVQLASNTAQGGARDEDFGQRAQ